jgi:hypothetical protein
MNLKEKIIKSKISRLSPGSEDSLIRRLEGELSRPTVAVPPVEVIPKVIKTPLGKEQRRSLTEADVEDFRSLNVAVHIRSKKHGDIFIVSERTGAPRFEILPEEIRMLSLAGATFDAKVAEVRYNVPA